MNRAPEDCRSMPELRAEIDRLDTALLDLFAERSAYIHRAAEIKRAENLPAAIPARVEEVIANVRRLATERDLPADLYAGLWEALVRRAIAEEEALLGTSEAPAPERS